MEYKGYELKIDYNWTSRHHDWDYKFIRINNWETRVYHRRGITFHQEELLDAKMIKDAKEYVDLLTSESYRISCL